jgi:hypothetical protein
VYFHALKPAPPSDGLSEQLPGCRSGSTSRSTRPRLRGKPTLAL